MSCHLASYLLVQHHIAPYNNAPQARSCHFMSCYVVSCYSIYWRDLTGYQVCYDIGVQCDERCTVKWHNAIQCEAMQCNAKSFTVNIIEQHIIHRFTIWQTLQQSVHQAHNFLACQVSAIQHWHAEQGIGPIFMRWLSGISADWIFLSFPRISLVYIGF